MSSLPAPEITKSLASFQSAKEGARRFHKSVIGDCDPDHCWADFMAKVANNDDLGIRKEYGHSLEREFGPVLDRSGVRAARSLGHSPVGRARTKAALAPYSGPTGGYLVPQELRDDLMVAVAEKGIMRPRATVVPMTTSTLQLPVVNTTSTPTASANQSAMWGGLNFSWLTDPGTLPETEPTWTQLELHAWELAGYALVSKNLERDALGLNAWLLFLFAGSLAWAEDYAFLVGNGAGKPQGVAAAPGTLSVTRQTGSTITVQDIGKMLGGLLPGSWERAIWACSPSCYQKLAILGTTQFQVNQPYYDEGAPKRSSQPRAVLGGLPLYVTERLPALGAVGDIVLFDPGLYVIGDRRAIEIAVADQEPTAFLKNQLVWRLVARVDGQPVLGKTVTLADGATSVGSMVALST